MHAEMRRFVDEGLHSGVVTLVARNGKLVDLYSYGKRDLEAGLPMQPDTIFRIYSMSKIVTSVAALVLLEDARFRLSDPVGDYLPELARMKVMTGGTAEKPLARGRAEADHDQGPVHAQLGPDLRLRQRADRQDLQGR